MEEKIVCAMLQQAGAMRFDGKTFSVSACRSLATEMKKQYPGCIIFDDNLEAVFYRGPARHIANVYMVLGQSFEFTPPKKRIRLRKHRFIYIDAAMMRNAIPLYRCVHCGSERYANLYELSQSSTTRAKCTMSPIKVGWWELLKGKIDCVYDTRKKR